MYKDGIIATINVAGNTLREQHGIVQLPFGSEYSIYVANTSYRRALVSVKIDGVDVLDGQRLVLNSNSNMHVRRSIRNGNMQSGNAFKFIQHTEGTASHRGVKAQDGLVQIDAYFEKPTEGYTASILRAFTKGVGGSSLSGSQQTFAAPAISYSAQSVNTMSVSTAGFTAPGSQVDQQFTSVAGFATETAPVTIVLKLTGEVADQPVTQALMTSTKLSCTSCGTSHSSSAKYCSECGTALQLI